MNLNNLIDCHTHTNLSPDGVSTAEEMCERAIELGLSAYAITDHCECQTWFSEDYYKRKGVKLSDDPFVEYDYKIRFDRAVERMLNLRENYDGRLNLLCGVELGQATQGWEGAEHVAGCKELDFIIGSLHQVSGLDDFAFINFTCDDKNQVYNILKAYYLETLEMAKWGKFDVLGHLTYPLRYIEGNAKIDVDMSRFDEIIRGIFCTLIENGKGIEINTSGLRQAYGKTFPTLDYVKMYHDLGGEILTIGSDSHCTEDLGRGVIDGIELAKSAGFKYQSYFKNRKAEFVKL